MNETSANLQEVADVANGAYNWKIEHKQENNIKNVIVTDIAKNLLQCQKIFRNEITN